MTRATLAFVIFGSDQDWMSFLGKHWIRHQLLYDATLDTGTPLENYPLAEWDDKEAWMHRHQKMHEDLADAWLVDPPPDLETWDLSHKDDFEQWVQAHSDEHDRIESVAGVE